MFRNTCLRMEAVMAVCVGMIIVPAVAQEGRRGEPARDARTHAASQVTNPADPAEELIDPAEVQRKIAALAVPDETLPEDERPPNWLSKRWKRIMPQLIAALYDPNPAVAKRVLQILSPVPMSKELCDALVVRAAVAGDPLRYAALRKLEQAADDPRVVALLDAASTDAAAFPDALTRARWASLGGQKARAVKLLQPFLAKPDSLGDRTLDAIRLLGTIGHVTAIPLLEPVARGDEWLLAAAAHQALAKIDPQTHALTASQTEFLKQAGQGFKETTGDRRRRVMGLAILPRAEVRPFVLQMLRDKHGGAASEALTILTLWKDREALPAIRGLLTQERPYDRHHVVAAYLAIDPSPQAPQDVLNLLEERADFVNEPVLRGIAVAEIPVERKVSLLLSARDKLRSPYAVPQAVRHAAYEGQDFAALLTALMDRETNLYALGAYCDLAAWDREKRFAAGVRRVMELLVAVPAVMTNQPESRQFASPATSVLNAVAAYHLKDQVPAVRKLMGSQEPTIRAAAQSAGARLGIPGATKDLLSQLGSDDTGLRQRAAGALVKIAPADETERAACEQAALSYLGTPAEDYAMRVLVTCGRGATLASLRPILDGPDVQRAVYAAWVLAQLPDKPAASKGLRRLAIFALFHHQMYQRGSGIDFPIAPDLMFHQVIGWLSLDPEASSPGEGPVQIPPELLRPWPLDEGEQTFAIASYRESQRLGPQLTQVPFLSNLWASDMVPGPRSRPALDASWVPLLKVMAAEDRHLKRLMVQGHAVAHFPYRQQAAQAVATLTGRAADYVGLAGERLDGQAAPQPYENQDKFLAVFAVDQIVKAAVPVESQTDSQWEQVSAIRSLLFHLRDEFGPQILDAVRSEAADRKVNVGRILPGNE